MDKLRKFIVIFTASLMEGNSSVLSEIVPLGHFLFGCLVLYVLIKQMHHENSRMKELEAAILKPERNKEEIQKTFASQYALYRADYFLSTFTFAKPLLLLLTTYLIIILGGFLYSSVMGMPLLEAIWLAWSMVADSGAHTDVSLASIIILQITNNLNY